MTRASKRPQVSLYASVSVPPRQRIWEAIRTLHASEDTITRRGIDHLVFHADPEATSRIADYLRALLAGGYLERVASGQIGTVAEYRLIRDVGVEAPRVRRDGTTPPPPGREQLWRTMKIIGEFTPATLAEAASTPGNAIARATANEYCHMLHHGGYLTLVSASKAGTPARYRLAPGRWTGPLAPQIRRTKEMFDPNTGETIYQRVTRIEGGDA